MAKHRHVAAHLYDRDGYTDGTTNVDLEREEIFEEGVAQRIVREARQHQADHSVYQSAMEEGDVSLWEAYLGGLREGVEAQAAVGIAAWLDDALRSAEGGDCSLLLEVQRLLGRRRWGALPAATQVRADQLLERCA